MKKEIYIDTNKAPINVLTSIIYDWKIHNVDIGDFRIKMNYMKLRKMPKSLIRKPNIDIRFERNGRFGKAQMRAFCVVRFYGNDNKSYEIESCIDVRYRDVFTNDYYIKNYIYTYLKYMLETTHELSRLYPLNLEYPSELFIEGKETPALHSLDVMQIVA